MWMRHDFFFFLISFCKDRKDTRSELSFTRDDTRQLRMSKVCMLFCLFLCSALFYFLFVSRQKLAENDTMTIFLRNVLFDVGLGVDMI